jgi:hypothetical protein
MFFFVRKRNTWITMLLKYILPLSGACWSICFLNDWLCGKLRLYDKVAQIQPKTLDTRTLDKPSSGQTTQVPTQAPSALGALVKEPSKLPTQNNYQHIFSRKESV